MNSKISDKDKKDWSNFLSSNEKLSDKDSFSNQKKKRREIVFDLHGFSLEDANKKIFNQYLGLFRHPIEQVLNAENNIKHIEVYNYFNSPSSRILALIFVAEIFCISSDNTISSIL